MEVKDCPNCAMMRAALAECVPRMANDEVYDRGLAALAPDAGRALLAELAALREVAEAAHAYDVESAPFNLAAGTDAVMGYYQRVRERLYALRDALAKLDALKAVTHA